MSGRSAALARPRFGPLAVDARAVALAAAGRLEVAGAVLAGAPPLRPDFYFSVFALSLIHI